MPKKSSSNTHQEAERAYKKFLDDYGINHNTYVNVKDHKTPNHGRSTSGQNKKTNSGTAPRARSNSRGRGNQSAASSRAASSERGNRSLEQCVGAKYRAAVTQYKHARDTMPDFERLDFMAAALMLCKTDGKESVLDYLRQHPRVEDKYYQEIKTDFDFVNSAWGYATNTDKSTFKYHIDLALSQLRKDKIDYRDHMSRATMAALVINKCHSSAADQKLTFQEYIKKHPHPDEKSQELQKAHFGSYRHDDQKLPGQTVPSGGRAQKTSQPPVLNKQLDESHSSFDTQHFGQVVPDEYRV